MKAIQKLILALVAVVSLSAMGSAATLRVAAAPRGYVSVYRPYFYQPYRPWGWGWGYDPWGYYPPVYSAPDPTGKIKLDIPEKTASVYVDGAYAGRVKDMKSFHLNPGNHDISIRDNEGHSLNERVHIVQGKTIKIQGDLLAGNYSNNNYYNR
jgi:hypothetical protein